VDGSVGCVRGEPLPQPANVLGRLSWLLLFHGHDGATFYAGRVAAASEDLLGAAATKPWKIR
jgi:hypothetical protein